MHDAQVIAEELRSWHVKADVTDKFIVVEATKCELWFGGLDGRQLTCGVWTDDAYTGKLLLTVDPSTCENEGQVAEAIYAVQELFQ